MAPAGSTRGADARLQAIPAASTARAAVMTPAGRLAGPLPSPVPLPLPWPLPVPELATREVLGPPLRAASASAADAMWTASPAGRR